MKITILGCGAAGGVPTVSRGWGHCDPNEPKNRRLRPSALITQGDTQVLVDTSPDCREQLLQANIQRLDGVLYTHTHADHTHGIDDLRELNRLMNAPLDIYASAIDMDDIRARFGYVIGDKRAGASIYKPMLTPNLIDGPFQVGDIDFIPFQQDHGWCQTTGFRFGSMAYSTDWVDLPPQAEHILRGVETWVVGCLTIQPHPTHAHLDLVLEWIERIGPKRAFLTHMTPSLDYQTLCRTLPDHVRPCHDGMVIEG